MAIERPPAGPIRFLMKRGRVAVPTRSTCPAARSIHRGLRKLGYSMTVIWAGMRYEGRAAGSQPPAAQAPSREAAPRREPVDAGGRHYRFGRFCVMPGARQLFADGRPVRI